VTSVGEITPEHIFQLHPKIRWVGMSTDQGEVLFIRMRPGIESLSPEDTDLSFVQLGPMILQGVCERLVPWAGPLETVVSSYAKVVLIVTKLGKWYLALTINKEDRPFIREIVQSLQTLKD
jgi:hypothetical protein